MTELVKPEVQKAFEFLYPVMEKRKKEEGYIWICQSEGAEVGKRFGVPITALSHVYGHIKEAFGENLEVFKFAEEAPRICWVMNRLKANGTDDLTDEQRLEFQKLFNRGRHIGKTLRSARIRLGINGSQEATKRADAPIPMPGYLGEVGVLLKRYQDLLQEKYMKESQLEKINQELEKYKPLASVMEAAKKTVQNIKENGA